MGRPKQSIIRDHQLNLSLTAAELETVRARAAAVGMRPVDYGRMLILKERPVLARVTERSGGERKMHIQLRRLGNNLNQLVRHLHMTKSPVPPDLEPLLSDIRRTISGGRP